MRSGVLWVIVGIISILAGGLALFNPLTASLTATMIAAFGFMIVGVLHIFAIFQSEGFASKLWSVLLAIAFIATGIVLWSNPLEGMMSLTLMVGFLFAFIGIARIVMAIALPKDSFFWIILLSGAVSIIMAVMIFTSFPESSVVILGVLLAIELISNGVSLVALGVSRKEGQPQYS